MADLGRTPETSQSVLFWLMDLVGTSHLSMDSTGLNDRSHESGVESVCFMGAGLGLSGQFADFRRWCIQTNPDYINSKNQNRLDYHLRLGTKAYCQSEQQQVKTEDLVLKQAQVLFRHGARTPILTIPNIPEAKYSQRVFRAALPHTDFEYDIVHLSGEKEKDVDNSGINKRYKRVLRGGIQIGQLTSLGMHQCYELGLGLKRRYMNRHKLIGSQYDESEVSSRSTYVKRTIESLQGVLAGLYGVEILTTLPDERKPKLKVAYYNEEHLYPNQFACDCLKDIAVYGKRRIGKGDPKHEELKSKCMNAVGAPKETPVTFIAFRDDLVARDAHSKMLPSELEEFYDSIHKQASIDFVQDIVGVADDRPAGLMLALGPFHHMLIKSMEYAIKGRKTPKLHLFSSHDSMVMPLLVALGCYEWEWPPYAAYISYELYQHKKTNEYYVKIIYNDRELVLPGKTDAILTYEEFKEVLDPFTLSPAQWKAQCKHTRASIDPPAVEYSLHYEESKFVASDEEMEDEAEVPAGM